MSNYICTITQVTVHHQGDHPTVPEAIIVSLEGKAGEDEFISLRQGSPTADGRVVFDPEELPRIQEAVHILLQQPSLYLPNPERTLTDDERAMCLEVLNRE